MSNNAVYLAAEIAFSVIVLACIVLGFRECDLRSREAAALQKIWLEQHCTGTPQEANKIYPYPNSNPN